MSKSRIMAFTWATMKNLFSKPVTKNYPAQPIQYPEGARGHIEIDIDECISCGLCERNCPPGALKVEKPPKGTWSINRFDCIVCGYCVSNCPKSCLHMVTGYQEPMDEKFDYSETRPHMGEEWVKAQAEKVAKAKAIAAQKAAEKAAAEKAATETK